MKPAANKYLKATTDAFQSADSFLILQNILNLSTFSTGTTFSRIANDETKK